MWDKHAELMSSALLPSNDKYIINYKDMQQTILSVVTNHTQRAACVITIGNTRDEAVALAEKSVGMLQTQTESGHA